MREEELNIGFTMKGNNILRSNTGDNMLLLLLYGTVTLLMKTRIGRNRKEE